MKALLTFFGAGGLQLKALIAGAIAALVACLALTAWALLERSGRLDCKVDLVAARAQVAVLSDQLKRQGKAVIDHAAVGAAVQGALRDDFDRILAAAGKRDPTLQEIRALLKHDRRPDGTAKDCKDAWAEIQKRVKP